MAGFVPRNGSASFRVESAGWAFRNARIIITHPLGYYLNISANHHNALKAVEFSQQCIRELENKHAAEDWSI